MNLYVNPLGKYIFKPCDDEKIMIDESTYEKCDPNKHFESWCEYRNIAPDHSVRVVFDYIVAS